ncbi:AsnC family transcriptional regulator [Streptomyces sp. NPDC002667]|uniref:AsnC family transcriptional regulator n=1 Tax=Streptomyces sp. NPDC002667 TaxID=3364657 RepID=UPI00368C4BF9
MARVSADSVLSLVDQRLVAALRCDGRLTAERAAQVLGLSPATVRRRLVSTPIRSGGLPAAFEGGQVRFGHLRSGGRLAHGDSVGCACAGDALPTARTSTSLNPHCGPDLLEHPMRMFGGPRPAPGMTPGSVLSSDPAPPGGTGGCDGGCRLVGCGHDPDADAPRRLRPAHGR